MTAQVTPALRWRSPDTAVRRSVRGPWTLAQFGRVVTMWLVAFIVLAVASVGSSTDADPTHASRWILLALVGGLLAGAGTTGWLVTGMRAVRSRQQTVTARIADLGPDLELLLGVTAPAADTDAELSAPTGLVCVHNGTRYHRADCLMVTGKPVVPADVTDPALGPCGVCRP